MYPIEKRFIHSHSHLISTLEVFYYFVNLFKENPNSSDVRMYENHFLTLNFYKLLVINLTILVNEVGTAGDKLGKHSIDKILNCLSPQKNIKDELKVIEQYWREESLNFQDLVKRLFFLRDKHFAHLDISTIKPDGTGFNEIANLLILCEDTLLKLDKLLFKSNLTNFNKDEFISYIEN